MPVKYSDIKIAEKRISDYIFRTSLEKSMFLSEKETSVYFKLECQQYMKCAKLRGALNKLAILKQNKIEKEIMTISSGNHGAAVSYGSFLLGIKNVTIYVPETSPKSKIEKMEYYGANIVKAGKDYDDAHRIGMKAIKDGNGIFIDPYSEEVIAGHGTTALEIFEQNNNIDTILVPIGGGGILTGISIAAKHINPMVEVIGLQTAACPAMKESLKDNVFYEMFPSKPSICDGLIGGVGKIPYEMAKQCIDDIWIIEEDDIARAVSFLVRKEKLIVEPAGAIGVAAVQKNYPKLKGKNVAVVITGGNIDDKLLVELLNKYS